MSGPLDDLARNFAFHDQALRKLTADFDESAWLHRNGDSSHAYWLLGHLTVARKNLLRGLGGSAEPEPWEEGFGSGSRPQERIGEMSVERLWAAFTEAGRQVVQRMRQLGEADLGADCGTKFPDGASTVGGMAHFLSFHEAYHIGQVGLLARSAGRAGLA